VLFKEYYYAVIQFESIPNPDIRKSLTQLSIELFDYIPSNAYTARIPHSINWKKLNELAVRAIFPLAAEQKSSVAVRLNKIPEHASSVKGYADITVQTITQFESSALANSFNVLGIIILDEQPNFRSFTLRVPAFRIQELVRLPFIQWVDFID
jgi:hypothetical protein